MAQRNRTKPNIDSRANINTKIQKQVKDPDLWIKTVKEVRNQDIADTPVGHMSPTKLKLAESRYKNQGGKFMRTKAGKPVSISMADKIHQQLKPAPRKTNKKTTK